ncbi:MAG: hypothetical protein KC464_25235, partial [Myxococcales bacterium]|nr:hypothetical protein [Myxococcales bacterium]
VGAALWWLGPTAIADDDAPAAGGADAWDFDPAIAALMEAGTLDRLQVRAGAVELDAAGVDFTLGPVEDHAHEVDDGYDEPGC